MEVLSQPINVVANFNHMVKTSKPTSRNVSPIPVVDLLKPDAKMKIVAACKEFGFFKLINHGVSMQLVTKLESEAVNFFNLSHQDKQILSVTPNCPFGYGNRKIGPNGDVGWVEYLLFGPDFLPGVSKFFWSLVDEYVSAAKELMCEVLEMISEELKMGAKDVLSRLIKDEKSDSCFRINHYPPCPNYNPQSFSNSRPINLGFGEHTDPQILSVARSNNTSGLQICLKDSTWISIPPDHSSFFFFVGDSLQVITNGRFKSVKHRVLTHSLKSRISMIYFGGPPLSEKITASSSLMEDGEEKLYEEFTWSEYKKSAYRTRLGENRLRLFEKSIK